jgi:uncharacterized protein involved in response to NO
MGIPRLRSYKGPAFLSYGFRPFFLLGSVYAGLSILFWLPAYSGQVETFSAFAPIDWHVHEMLFGYLSAIVTGFLLTAIPNWTGRLPVLGVPVAGEVVTPTMVLVRRASSAPRSRPRASPCSPARWARSRPT